MFSWFSSDSSVDTAALAAQNLAFAASCRESTNLWSVTLGIILRTILKVVAGVIFGIDDFEDSPSCFWPLWNAPSASAHGGAVRVLNDAPGGGSAGADSPVFRLLGTLLAIAAIVLACVVALDQAKQQEEQEARIADPHWARRARIKARKYRRERASTVAWRKGTSQEPFIPTLETIME